MRKLKKWAMSVVGVALVWQMFRVVGCAGAAYADPSAAGDWHSPAAAAGLTATDLAAWAALVLGIAIVTLRVVAPRTKVTWDDELLARLESLEGVVHGPPPPTGPFPAIVSGTIESKDGGS